MHFSVNASSNWQDQEIYGQEGCTNNVSYTDLVKDAHSSNLKKITSAEVTNTDIYNVDIPHSNDAYIPPMPPLHLFDDIELAEQQLLEGIVCENTMNAENTMVYEQDMNTGQQNDFVFVMNAQNFHYVVPNLLKNAHATQRFKVKLEDGQILRWSMADIQYDTIEKLIIEHGKIYVSKIDSKKKIVKFGSKNISNKRSVAFCHSIIRGIALAEMMETLEKEVTEDKCKIARKKLLNKFTNCSRRDSGRNAGMKLEKEFLAVHKHLHKDSECGEIDHYFRNKSIFMFDPEGYLILFVTPELCKKSYYFYQGEKDLFMIKNFKGFCRVDD